MATTYCLQLSIFERWITHYSTTDSLKTKDNRRSAVAFKTMKTKFVKNVKFTNINELRQGFSAYAYRYNNNWRHSSSGYLTPMAFNRPLSLNFVI